MRVAVILNRNARRFARRPDRARRVEAEARAAGVSTFAATGSLADLAHTAAELRIAAPDVVALVGGDGSFMSGVTALHRAWAGAPLPRIAFVPGGTVARVARTLGPSRPRLLARLTNGGAERVRTQTLLVCTEGTSTDEARVGFIFGTGLVARFFDVYYERGARGVAGAAAITARVFAESFIDGPFARRVLEPIPCALDVDGVTQAPTAWSLVVCSVLRDLGLHMLVTYRAGEDPARLHLVASPLSPRELGPRAGRVLAGRSIGGPGHVDALAQSFTLRFPGDPGPFVLDGDVFRAPVVRVSVGPELEVVR